ncbi:flagellar biosynthesis anti-sigma factor FlgM [Sphingomonas sp. CGMCC 1.13654]|uniref:Negative regulator of flagellin synthesis n=1 Tax=Sphingomonas chungangi TaxID=2683589 RepID=A0A838LB48_9SPHN|nr:flagellar biosynthesis anti-sigma factor FlgM [Sphingomonas chungangi]MBA2936062.1 flagellar biosynthesis anti-sigma factor FlgM [Sphingomonas chungangi]MVW55451.1 flagellar biosynthesis anti-sigma factor FlgM [Sphingomonas chungangi]
MDGIDKAGGATDVSRLRPSSVQPTQAAAPVAAAQAKIATNAGLSDAFAALADTSVPVDSKKVDAIKSLIQSGAYPIDPQKIAAKMVALDFPERGESADA